MAEYGDLKNREEIDSLTSIEKETRENKSFTQISPRKKRRISTKLDTKLIFFRQLSVILRSGIPLSQGLRLLSDDILDKKFANCVRDLASQLNSGKDLSSSLKEYPRIFDTIVVGLIEAGEVGGILPDVLERIVSLLDSKNKLRSQITGALIYPVMLLILALSVSMGLLIFIVPTFEDLFRGLGADLPGLTQFMLDLSRFVTSPIFLIFAPIVSISFFLGSLQYYSTYRGKLLLDSFFLRIPIFGDLILRSELASFSDTLSTLINAGVTITESLEKCILSASNQVIKNAIKKSIVLVREGQLLGYSFSLSKAIPTLFTSMIKIGEETGELSFIMENISLFYKREVEDSISIITKLMEPAVIFIVAAIVGTIVISLYLPMFSLLEKLN